MIYLTKEEMEIWDWGMNAKTWRVFGIGVPDRCVEAVDYDEAIEVARTIDKRYCGALVKEA